MAAKSANTMKDKKLRHAFFKKCSETLLHGLNNLSNDTISILEETKNITPGESVNFLLNTAVNYLGFSILTICEKLPKDKREEQLNYISEEAIEFLHRLLKDNKEALMNKEEQE